MRYRTNSLKQVILRLDFNALPKLQAEQTTPFSQDLKDRFPKVASNALTQLTFAMGAGASFDQQITGWQWIHTAEQDRKVILNPGFLALEYGAQQYHHFPEFRETFDFVFQRFQQRFAVAEFNRVGLRYVNEITIDDGAALDWDGIIAPGIVTAVKPAIVDGMLLTRSMHQVVARDDDVTAIANFGIYNPDFPNPIARRQFVLDFDAAVAGGVPAADLLPKVERLNKVCEGMFEASIEQGLRERMEIIP